MTQISSYIFNNRDFEFEKSALGILKFKRLPKKLFLKLFYV